MASESLRPPKGKRTILQTLLNRAEDNPDQLYGSFPLTDNIEDGFRDFTVGELAQAVDVCAWKIKEQYGIGVEYETILYMGVSDFRYTIFTYAAIKCGYKVGRHSLNKSNFGQYLDHNIQACFQNPGNPVHDNLAILEQTSCVKAFYSEELEDLLVQYRRFRPQLLAFELPPLMHFFESTAQPFPYHPKPWDEAKYEPIVVLHSSGTTGAPKPLTYRNGIVKCLDSPWPDDVGPMNLFSQLDGGFCYAPVPSFHTGGFLLMTLLTTMSTHCALVTAPAASSAPKNAHIAIQIIKQKNVKLLTAMPFLLENLMRTAEGIETLARLEYVTYGGAPLRKTLGDELCSKGVQPLSIYGATETAFLPLQRPSREAWDWMRFPPELKVSWEELDAGNGTYELCFRSESEATNELRGTHWSLQVDDWRSKDLFVRHPCTPDLWRYIGRRDDMLILGTGINITNPTVVEEALQSHRNVSGALLAGENRWPPCVLLETYDDVCESDVEAFRVGLQPVIDEANQLIRADARIPHDYVVILGPGSFVRNPKGGIVRGKTVQKHKKEIDRIYAKQQSV